VVLDEPYLGPTLEPFKTVDIYFSGYPVKSAFSNCCIAPFFSREKAQKMTYIPFTQRTGGIQQNLLFITPFQSTCSAAPIIPQQWEVKG